MPAPVPVLAVVAFCVLACGLAWLVCLPLWVGGRGLAAPYAGSLLKLMMFVPLVSALIVVFVIQRPQHRLEYLGLWPLRPLKRTIWLTVIAIVGMPLIIVAGVFLAAALGLVPLDLQHFSGYAATLKAVSPTPIPVPIGLLVLIQIATIPIGAVINAVFTIGEEVGWRGWLLPSLRPLGTWPALVITGAVWGFWHAPIILLGYNFNQPNWFGVGLMVVASIMAGILIGWLRLRTASVWPSVFAHGALNAAGGFIALVIAAGAKPDLVSSGPLGWVTWIVMAVVIIVLLATGQFRRQPRLEHRPQPAPQAGAQGPVSAPRPGTPTASPDRPASPR